MRRTALYNRHRVLQAKMTEFHGWEMPLYYTSILDEHRAVREGAGIFDISHMGQVLLTGSKAMETLNRLVVSDISQVSERRACYSLLLNDAGGIIDDLIIYRLGARDYLLIVNCANRQRDLEWLTVHGRREASVSDISEERSILAVQGPMACSVLERVIDSQICGLGRFEIMRVSKVAPDVCLARTGYTGSDGFEIFLSNRHAARVWDMILESKSVCAVMPVGLGARDTLRVEAGLRLHGTDMDSKTTPFEVGLDWTVAINKPDFIGKDVLVKQKRAGLRRRFVGFELEAGPVPRLGCELLAEASGSDKGWCQIGAVTSGTYSPVLGKPLGMGYVESAFANPGSAIAISVRGKSYRGRVVKLPFWKRDTQGLKRVSSTASTGEKMKV